MATLGKRAPVPRAARDLARAVQMQARALERERAGVVRAADFFWEEMLAALARQWRSPQALAGAFNAIVDGCPSPGTDSGAVAATVVRDAFLDVHLAVLRGMPAGDVRADIHIGYARRIIALAPGHAALRAREAALDDYAFRHLLSDGRRDEAVAVGVRAAGEAREQAQDPESPAATAADEWVRRVLKAVTEQVFGSLSTATDAASSQKDADRLGAAVTTLDALRAAHEHVLDLYQALCELSCTQAVKLALANSNAAAARAVVRGLRYDPMSQTAIGLLQQLTERVLGLESELEKVAEQIRTTPNAVMNAEGVRMVADVRSAREILAGASQHDTSDSVAEGFGRALDVRLWQRVGLRSERWSSPYAERTAALRRVLGAVDRRDDDVRLEDSVRRALSAEPALAEADAAIIVSFLRGLRHEGDGSDAEAVETASPPADDEGAVPTLADVAGERASIPAPARRRNGIEPVRAWLGSDQGRGVKRAVLTASVAFAAVLVAVAFDSWAEPERERRFRTLLDRALIGEPAAVQHAAQRFLGLPNPVSKLLRGADPRDVVAGVLLSVALDESRVSERDEALAAAQTHFASGESQAALEAIARFKNRLTPGVQESRLARVEALERLARDLPARRERDAAVIAMVEALAAGDADGTRTQVRRFLDQVTPHFADPRVEAVREVGRHADDLTARRQRDAADAALQAALGSGELEQALDAAQRFLEHRTRHMDDPREPRIRAQYEQTFLAWLLYDVDAAEPAANERAATLAALAPAKPGR